MPILLLRNQYILNSTCSQTYGFPAKKVLLLASSPLFLLSHFGFPHCMKDGDAVRVILPSFALLYVCAKPASSSTSFALHHLLASTPKDRKFVRSLFVIAVTTIASICRHLLHSSHNSD